jgi:dihydrofolate reductase
MSKLIYITHASLDGYIEDQTDAFDWSNPDQVFDFITELMRPIGTHLLGRRLYETMAHWDGPLEGIRPNTATSHGSGRRPSRSSSHER